MPRCAPPVRRPQRWIGIGADRAEDRVGPDAVGTFAGYGTDVPVAMSPDAHTTTAMPLCALITGWLRGEIARERYPKHVVIQYH